MLGVGPEAGNVVGSHAHVPGSVLRGALASLWLLQHGGHHSGADRALRREFVQLFEGDVRFGPLLAEGSTLEPLSVKCCKYRPKPACYQVTYDASDVGSDRRIVPAECPFCSGAIDWCKGRILGPPLVETTRTQLTADETADPGQLFTRRGLAAGTRLRGTIAGGHQWLLSESCNGSLVWLGGRRTVGGRARLSLTTVRDSEPSARPDGLVALRLLSPGIFVDDATRPSLGFPAADVARALGCGSVRMVRRWQRPARVGGWHAASGLPKPQEMAVAAGSTVLFEPSGAVGAAGLRTLQLGGVGLRRHEGFGSIVVNPGPWVPAAVAEEGESSFPEDEIFASIRPALDDPSLRAWLVDVLKERAVALEAGRPGPVVAGRRRLRPLPEHQRAAVECAVAQTDIGMVGALIELLDAPELQP